MKSFLLAIGKVILAWLMLIDFFLIIIHLIFDVWFRGMEFEVWAWYWFLIFLGSWFILFIWDLFFNF